MDSRSALQLRAVALATTATLALGAAACGSSDDDSNGGSDQQQARATVESLYAALRASDAAKACEQLTEAGQKQLQQGGRGPKGDTCAETFQKFLDRGKKEGGLSLALKAKIKSIKVTGDTAVAKVNFGEKGPSGDINLEKVDGEWKVSAAGASPSN
jgi:hypothetical protein